MPAKKQAKQVNNALPITDADADAAIVRGLIAGLPPEFEGATKHLREIARRCEVIGRRGKSKLAANAVSHLDDFVQWLGMFAAGFAEKKEPQTKREDVSLF